MKPYKTLLHKPKKKCETKNRSIKPTLTASRTQKASNSTSHVGGFI